MKVITNNFKQEITKLGKQIDCKINVFDNNKIITENGDLLLTEDNLNLIVEQINVNEIRETITSEDIYNLSIITKGNLLSTLMKEIDFEISQDLKIGDIVDCSFGLKVGDNYEYVNYGKFIIYSKEKNEDTNTYSYVAFDSMLLSMIEVNDTSIIQGITVKQAIENICDKVGLEFSITAQEILNLPNLANVINENAFTDIQMTYRDVLDMICQCLGVSMIIDNKTLKLKTFNNTVVDTIDEMYLKDINVKFSDKYMINSVVLSRSEDTDTIYRRDEESIAENGVHEFKIKDNLIMNFNDREDYIDEIFEQLNGLEFYINDFQSTGITYLDWLDFYNINIGENTYKCLLLNDEIKINQGLEESIYTEQPEETTTDYKTSGKTDKEVSFIVDKQNGQIKSRVTQDEMETAINQTAEEINIEVNKKVDNDNYTKATIIAKINDNTSQAQINADNIDLKANDVLNILSGNSINLSSNNISINSNNFDVSSNGNLSCSNATITGGTLNISNSTGADIITLTDTRNGFTTTMTGSEINIMYTSDSSLNAQLEFTGLHFNNASYLAEYNPEYAYFRHSPNYTYVDADDGITHSSREEYKKNIELRKNNIELIKKAGIYNYLFKNEDDKKKPHIGLIIGDKYNTPKEIINEKGDGINLFDMCGVMWGAIKEQQEIIEKLQRELQSIKESDK